MNAANAPVRRAPTEMHTDDVSIAPKASIETREDLAAEIVIAPEVLKKEYADALKFAEEPVTIRIERSSEKFASKVVDLWCNGRGAEVLINGRWVETKVLPVGQVVTTKRKFVEILARSKEESIETQSGKIDEHSERNIIDRSVRSKTPFSVIEDRSPKAQAWLTGLVRFG